jgi:uncharacterized membrane protein (GlpM family)
VRLLQIAISMIILLAIAWIGDRQRHLAGLLSAMPLTIPLAMWIVFMNTGGDYQKTAEMAAGAVTSIFATAAFVVIVYLLIRARVHFALAIAGGYAVWGVVAWSLPLLSQEVNRLALLFHK